MNIKKIIKVELTDDELAYIRGTFDIIEAVCDAAEGECDICPLKPCCRDQKSLRNRIASMHTILSPDEKS